MQKLIIIQMVGLALSHSLRLARVCESAAVQGKKDNFDDMVRAVGA